VDDGGDRNEREGFRRIIGLMDRRVAAGSIVFAMVAPWAMVVAVAVHVSLHHDHDADHDVADRVASAWHGHAHDSGAIPHEHSAAPAQVPFSHLASGFATAVLVSVVTPSADPQPSLWVSTAKRSPPQPPTASPPILRV
jgi:hypothetical protein